MQRQRGELVPIAEALADLPGHVKAICEATPQALHHFTQADQVNQLVTAREADPDRGFMARTMAQAAVALTQLIRPPGLPVRFSPANYALLSRPTNSEFDDKPPDEVFAPLTPAQRKLAAVQFFGEAAGDRLKPDSYEESCEWRADRLAEAINDWLGMD